MPTQAEIIGDMHKEIARLTAERDAALEALKPFAQIGLWRDTYPDAKADELTAQQLRGYFKAADIRAARAALSITQQSGEGK